MPPSLALETTHELNKLPTCNPYLMPFHIHYSGPAPISTYLRVNAAKENVGAPAAPSDDAQTTSDKPAEPSSGEAVATDNMDVDVTTPVPVVASSSSSSSSTPSLAKRVTDATTRFISSFRGRTIQGLKVDIPAGYIGVVLRSNDASDTKSRSKAREEKVKKETKGKRPKRGSKKIRDEEVEDDKVSESGFIDDESGLMSVELEEEEIRTLSVTSQFSSFTLWHADHPVDEGRDEYLRSLTEWTQLAKLIHGAD